MKTNFILFIIFIGVMIACSCPNEKSGLVTVEIRYQTDSVRTSSVSWKQGLSTLEALQHAAHVETHPVGEYVFVSSINSTGGNRGKTAWYYKVNGVSAKVIAINQEVNTGDTITWIFKDDICSKTVDKCN